MASTKIQNLPLKAPIGAMKIPTGGFGDYSITVSSIGDFIIDAFNLATKDYVDNLLVEKEDRIDTTGGYLTPVSQNSSVPDTTNDVIDEVAQALLDRIEYVKDNFGIFPEHNQLTGRSASGAHPSTSISHKSGTVYTYLQQNESDINNINNVSIPTINQTLLSKQDLIETGEALTPVSAQSPVPSVSHTGLNSAIQALLNRTAFFSNHNNLTNRNDLNAHSALSISDSSGLNQQTINNLSVSVLHYGAKSNEDDTENFDSTQAFKDALNFEWVVYPDATSLAYYPKAKNKRIRVPLGRYLVTDTLPLTSYLHLDFDDGVVIDFQPTTKKPLFAPPVQIMQAAYAAGATTWKDMTIYGLRMTGAALLKGNMTGSSTVHATYGIQAANTHRALFSRLAIEGFENGLAIERLDTSSWTGGSPIGNFYENVVDNVSIQDCKIPFFNSGNLTTMIGCRIGHEVLQKTDPNMGDYLMVNYGAGFTSSSLNIASVWRGANPKKGHIFEACAGSTYEGLYSEYFDYLFVVDPINRFGGLSFDPSHLVKYPGDVYLKFVDGYMPSYDPATGLRGGKNLKAPSNFVELLTGGIRIMNSNAQLIEDFFEFAPQYDFKYGMYGTEWYWSKNIAVDFKRWETKSTGFLSPFGARFIATQDTEIAIKTKYQQYDVNICILMRDLVGNYSAGDIKLNVQGANEFISVAEVVYDYGNGWKMYALRNAQTDPDVETSLRIVIPQGRQIEIEHIGAYKGGIPLYPTFKDYKPKVNSDNYMFTGSNDVDGGAYQYKFSGGQFGLGDELAPFIPKLPDGSIVTNAAKIANQYVSKEGSNRQTIKDGNHTGYYGSATITFTDISTFDSAVTTSGNSRNFAESIGIGQYVGITQDGVTTSDTKVVGRVYDVVTQKYTTNLIVNKNFNVSTAVISHADARKPVFENIGSLSGSKTWDPLSLAANEIKSTTVTVSGAVVGNKVDVGFSVALGPTSRIWGEVSEANTVTVYHQNLTSVDLDVASGILSVRVNQ